MSEKITDERLNSLIIFLKRKSMKNSIEAVDLEYLNALEELLLYRNKWISVKDELPKPREGFCKTVLAINMNESEPYPFVAGYTDNCGFDALVATHWLLLPPPPNRE